MLDGDSLRVVLNQEHAKTESERIGLGLTYVRLASELVEQENLVILSAVAMYKEIFYSLSKTAHPTSIFFIDANRENRLERDIDKGIYLNRDLLIEDLTDNLPSKITRIENNSQADLEIAAKKIINQIQIQNS